MESQSQSKVLKWILSIGIVIVLNLFFNYALSLVYPAPTYDQFCPQTLINSAPQSQTACIKVGGQWTATPATDPTTPTTVSNQKVLTPTGYCDPTYTCSNNYTTASQNYDKNVFIILLVLGVLSIIGGLLLKASDAVSIGLSLGGVLSLIIGSVRYWSEAGNILKVIILALALIALIWLGVKKFRNQ